MSLLSVAARRVALRHRAVLVVATLLTFFAGRRSDAQAPTSPADTLAPAPRVQWEYAQYVGERTSDGFRMFATSTAAVSGKHWKQFADRMGMPRLPAYPLAEPAFFTWLGARGWELVGCTRGQENVSLLGEQDWVTRCHFRRSATTPDRDPAPSPPAA